jgi:hypothetical protein
MPSLVAVFPFGVNSMTRIRGVIPAFVLFPFVAHVQTSGSLLRVPRAMSRKIFRIQNTDAVTMRKAKRTGALPRVLLQGQDEGPRLSGPCNLP